VHRAPSGSVLPLSHEVESDSRGAPSTHRREDDCQSGARHAAKGGASNASAARPVIDLRGRFALRPGELAAALGIGERTLRELAPELPRIRRGGVLLYPVDGIREWLRREARVEGEEIRRLVAETLSRI
jgi:hypothetical protein